MAYGILKCDTVTFTNDGVDKSITLSGLVQNPTFSGNVTVTGTFSGVTVTGTTASFTSGNFTNISGGTHTITSGVFAAGSAASPSITFTGDLNTGIYSPGADQLAISTGGSGRLFVDASGRVGIGTSVPYAPLQVNGAIRSTFVGDGSDYIGWGSGGGSAKYAYIAATNEGAQDVGLSFNVTTNAGSSNIEAIRIDDLGNVGIGTTSPATKCVVSNNGAEGIEFEPATLSGVNQVQSYNRSGASYNSLVFNAADLRFAISGTSNEKARIDSSGRLLVGTSSSAGTGALLQTRSDNFSAINQENFYSAANGTGPNVIFAKSRGSAASPSAVVADDFLGIIRFRGYDGTDYDTSGAEITVQVDGTPGANDMPGRLVFSTTADGASSPTERMRITSNGNIIQNYYVFDPYNAAGFITGAGTYIGGSSAPGVGLACRGASNANAGVISFGGSSTNGNPKTLAAIIVTQDNTSTNRANGYLRFYTNRDGAVDASATPIERVRFTDRILCDVTTITSLTSERRLKQDIDSAPLNPELSWNVARDLPIRSFAYKNNPESTNYGYIVDEVEAVDPSLIFDTGETDDEGPIRSYDNAKLQAMYHLALKQALAKIETLEAKVAALETP